MSGGLSLRLDERETISRELTQGKSARSIATILGGGRHHSAISREIKNNGGRDNYRAVEAQQRSEALRARPKPHKLFFADGTVRLDCNNGQTVNATAVVQYSSMTLYLPNGSQQKINNWSIERMDAGYGYEFLNLSLDGYSYLRQISGG